MDTGQFDAGWVSGGHLGGSKHGVYVAVLTAGKPRFNRTTISAD